MKRARKPFPRFGRDATIGRRRIRVLIALLTIAVVCLYLFGYQGPKLGPTTTCADTAVAADAVSVYRPDGLGGLVRVLVVAMSENMQPSPLCHAVAKANLFGLSIVTTTFSSGELGRFARLHQVGQDMGLGPRDVLIGVSSGLTLKGNNDEFVRFVDSFIVKSPEYIEALDARRVREGHAAAPVSFSPACDGCEALDPSWNTQVRAYANDNVIHLAQHTFSGVSSDLVVARVWAFQDWLSAFTEYYRKSQMPWRRLLLRRKAPSLLNFYQEAFLWEIEDDLLILRPSETARMDGPYVALRGGLLGSAGFFYSIRV